MATYVPLHNAPVQYVDSNGDPLTSGTLEFFLSGTSTPSNLFSDSSGTVLGTSVTLNSDGYPESGGNVITLFRDTSVNYKIICKDSAAATIWTADTLTQDSQRVRARHGQIYVAAADSGAITISDTTNYFEATAMTWTLSSGGYEVDESDGNGKLTYTGTENVHAHIAASISITCASSNQVLHFRLGKNGTTDAASEVQRKVGTGTDVGSTALHLMTSMSTGDHISLWCRNETSAANVTIETANIQLMTAPPA